MDEPDVRRTFMSEAIALAERSVAEGGGPFGAVVVREGRIIGRGHNRVVPDNDPSAHAEIVALRDACRTLGDFRLEDCELYVNCEPCSMCLAAAYWARVARIYYGASMVDATAAGFDDTLIMREVCMPQAERRMPMGQMMREESLAAFAAWRDKGDRVEY